MDPGKVEEKSYEMIKEMAGEITLEELAEEFLPGRIIESINELLLIKEIVTDDGRTTLARNIFIVLVVVIMFRMIAPLLMSDLSGMERAADQAFNLVANMAMMVVGYNFGMRRNGS